MCAIQQIWMLSGCSLDPKCAEFCSAVPTAKGLRVLSVFLNWVQAQSNSNPGTTPIVSDSHVKVFEWLAVDPDDDPWFASVNMKKDESAQSG